MKRVIAFVLLAAIVLFIILMLFSCGNMSYGPGNFSYKHIHISDQAINAYCATVERWYDNETGIEVKTTEYGSIFLSEGSYILIESGDKCPFCN